MDANRGSSSTSSSNGSASAGASGKKKMKYVCVTGGVVSGLGKGKRRRNAPTCGIPLCMLFPFPSPVTCILFFNVTRVSAKMK